MQKDSDASPSCEGKQKYISLTAAEKGAQRIRRKYHDLVVGYKCPICRRFHIGHPKRIR